MEQAETVEIKLIKSLIGIRKSQIAVLASLGLRKIGDMSTQKKNLATLGKIKKVSHMLCVK